MFYLRVAIIVVILPDCSIGHSQVSDFQDRIHHEHFFQKTIDPNELTNEGVRDNVLFPRTKTCVRPNQIRKRSFAGDDKKHAPKPDEEKDPSGQKLNAEGKWDSFLSMHHYDVGETIEDWKKEQEVVHVHRETDASELPVFVYVLTYYVLFIIVCVLTLPIVGFILFHAFYLLWKIVTLHSFRIILRNIWISNEKRKMKQIALLRAIDPKSQKVAGRYRPVLPGWMRKYRSEETPAELIESDEESDGVESSDGFETEYVTKTAADKLLKKHPKKVNLGKSKTAANESISSSSDSEAPKK